MNTFAYNNYDNSDEARVAVRIEPVAGKSGLDDFISVPWQVYTDDPCWVPPLKFERREALSAKHPFFQHARWQPFVAYQDGLPVGRMAVQIDDYYQQRHDSEGGFFGMFELRSPPTSSLSGSGAPSRPLCLWKCREHIGCSAKSRRK